MPRFGDVHGTLADDAASALAKENVELYIAVS
jgi:hypothetical protein